ncbi:MAG: GAF domain-containing SpoIIE family protein phosphatase [Planctomycetaceae bacterium]
MQAALRAAVSDGADWITGICRRFSDATGWLLEFVPCATGEAPSDPDREGEAEDYGALWSAEIDDGERVLGRMRIVAPDEFDPEWSFTSIGALAEVLARMVRRCATMQHALETRAREVSTLVDIGRSLSRDDDPRQALGQLLRAACQLTRFRAAAFFLLDPLVQRLQLRGVHPGPFDSPASTDRPLRQHPPDLRALTGGRMTLDRREDDRSADWLPPGMALGVCLPVQSDGGPIGTLWVYDRRRREPEDRELHVLDSIAAQIAAVLERSVLLRESAVQHRLKQDLLVASEFQSRDVVPELPAEWNVELAGLCTSRWEIGGDLCEIIPLAGDRLLIAVGDASGDSIPAALVMSAVRGALRSLADDEDGRVESPAAIAARLNRALCRITPAHQFMSLVCGVLDVRERSFAYTNAGHPTPLHARGGAIVPLESHGMLLGILPDAAYAASRSALSPGDLLVFYSDGVTEAMSRRQQMFRSEGIAGVLRSRRGDSARAVHDAICAELSEHMLGSDDADDRTLLVVRMT